MMHGHEKSDPGIVAMKPANKAERFAAEQSAAEPTAAEPVEPRAGTKGNVGQQSTCRTQSRESVSQALDRIRKAARERKKEKFTALYHHISTDLLEAAFTELKKDAAPGVDRLTWKDYEANLERNIADLHNRVQRGAYRAVAADAVVRVRLDRKATSISLLVVIGVRADGQKVLLAVKSMGGETAEAWRVVLDDLVKRGLRQPEFLIVDGGTGLEQALATLWGDVPTQRCTVHKHRNLLAHAPPRLHDEVSADYNDMIYATSPAEIEERRRAFLRKWRLTCKAVADSLEEAGERLHEEFKRRIKTQTVLPSAETAAMLFWALLAAGQITMRKVDGWQTLNENLADKPIDLAA